MQVIESNIGPRVGLHAYVRSSDPNSAFLRMAGHQYQLGHRTQTPPFCVWHAFKSVIGPKFRLPMHGGPSTSTRSSDPNSAFLRMARHQLGHRTQIPPSCAWQVIGHKFRPREYAYVSNRSSDPTSDFIHTVGSLRTSTPTSELDCNDGTSALVRTLRRTVPTFAFLHMAGHRTQISTSRVCLHIESVIGPNFRLHPYRRVFEDIDPNFRTRLQRPNQRLGAHLATHSANIRLPQHGRSSDPNSDLASMPTYRIGHRTQLPTSSIP
ncbi:hypothetical protein SUGI_1220070 [Cryptomeria japonica]|uniref:Uncharacterized protein n=1 Tax=Cryptomeria japonica TaxID=3369 RepID=A0AAD3NRK3_CRYJA|nr:hypothetical protein SUGI_1220070 [Cryptomeria japonica]